jgi:hypothetical protein
MVCTRCGRSYPYEPDGKRGFVVKSSPQQVSFEGGAVRGSSEGKPRYDLISPYALRRLAMHMAKGAKLYGDRNWEKGMPRARLFESAMRHMFQAFMGERDEDHLSAVLFNIMGIIHFEEREPSMARDSGEPVSKLAEIGRKLHLTEDLEKLTYTKLAPEMTDDELRLAVCRPKRAEVCQHCGGKRTAVILDPAGASEEIPCPMCCCRYCGKPKADHLNGDCP